MANEPGPSSDAPTLAARTLVGGADTLVAEGDLAGTEPSTPDERYATGAVIGRGGMGLVRSCADRVLGRQVALKTMLFEAHGTARARFLREVRLQAVLEHPSIVPVYDLGRTADGTPYFTMRQIGGDTLERIIHGLAKGDADLAARYGRRRLLGDFVRVCQAVAYAHSRGVVHRDLKPANVILSDYGEVYVLDWGIAKVTGDASEDAITASSSIGSDGATADGSVLGTLGYMPPEQLEGAGASVDQRADIYALGAILFELLTLQPLHARGDASAIIRATLAVADARASSRMPDRDVPPELEAVCVRATATAREDRHRDLLALIGEIERYLDGDRDQQRRRELADEHARLAELAMVTAEHDLAARERAAREAGRALALDPTQAEALRVVTRLVLEPPSVMPPEIEAKLRTGDNESSQAMARFGSSVRIIWLVIFAAILAMGVRIWPLYFTIVALLVGSAIGAARFGKYGTQQQVPWIVMVSNAFLLALMSSLFGTFVLVPAVAIVTTVTFMLGGARGMGVTVAFGLAAIFAPYVLELAGVLPTITHVTREGIVISPMLASFPPVPTHIVLVVGHLAAVAMAGVAVAGARARLRLARSQELLQAWHFEKVLPAPART